MTSFVAVETKDIVAQEVVTCKKVRGEQASRKGLHMSEALTISAKEASQRLGIGLTTTYRLLRLGRLPAVRVGTRPNFRVPVRAIEEALAEPGRLSIGSAKESRSE